MTLKYFYLFFLGILLICCSTTSGQLENKPYRECVRNYKNDFAEVTQEKYITITNNDTLVYTQIKFKCTSSALYNLRTMYGYYGKWHESIIPKNKEKPLLIWKNIDLFSNGQKYDIVTFGDEITRDDVSTSVMVFDNEGKDVLKNDEDFKIKIIEFFTDNIRNNKNRSKVYYQEYLKEFAPEYWEKYKIWNGIN